MLVEFRLPDEIVLAICRAYPEARSCSEAVKLFILEVLAGRVEERTLPEELFKAAQGVLAIIKQHNKKQARGEGGAEACPEEK